MSNTDLRRADHYGCALRTRTYAGIPQRLEIGNEVANLITTVYKDSMVIQMDGKIRIRKLTPKECFRLMAFSDQDYEACKDAGLSNSQLYKQAGNSICVCVLEAIFGQMIDGKENAYREGWGAKCRR